MIDSSSIKAGASLVAGGIAIYIFKSRGTSSKAAAPTPAAADSWKAEVEQQLPVAVLACAGADRCCGGLRSPAQSGVRPRDEETALKRRSCATRGEWRASTTVQGRAGTSKLLRRIPHVEARLQRPHVLDEDLRAGALDLEILGESDVVVVRICESKRGGARS